jgi:ketosteroid isomerase-like protein
MIYGTGSSVAIHFTASGTARDGKPYSNEYAWFFEMSGGKVLRVVAFVDAAAFNELWTRVTPKEVA